MSIFDESKYRFTNIRSQIEYRPYHTILNTALHGIDYWIESDSRFDFIFNFLTIQTSATYPIILYVPRQAKEKPWSQYWQNNNITTMIWHTWINKTCYPSSAFVTSKHCFCKLKTFFEIKFKRLFHSTPSQNCYPQIVYFIFMGLSHLSNR